MDAINTRPDPSNSSSNDDLIISVKDLKDIYLFGLDLTDDNGNEFPEIMYTFAIRAAQEWVEKEVGGLILSQKDITEVHDYYANDYQAFMFLKLWRFPLIAVDEVSVQFPLATNKIVFDPSWYRPQGVGHQVQLVPTAGTFSNILMNAGGSYLSAMYSGNQNLPAMIEVKYKAGFAKDKIPTLIKEIVGMKASIAPLNVAGDLIGGAGIASSSLGIDGLSQSISTTSSATNAGYGARVIQYNKELKNRMKNLKEYYGGINMVVA
jgi:hypothetical protein